MPAFLQSALGSGIGITDFRSHCQMHHSLARDTNSSSERELRQALMEDPAKAKSLQTKYVQATPYFDIDKCWNTTNPPVGFPHYNSQ